MKFVYPTAALVIALLAMPLPAIAASNSLTDARLTMRIDEVVRSEVAKGFSGAVLVARDNTIILDKAYGGVRGVAMRTSSKFWIASAGKQFVSAAILKCQDNGWLKLDDPLSRFFPDVPSDKRAITIRQLLAHLSGFDQAYVAESATNRSEAVKHIWSEPLIAVPGAKFHYSNNNYELGAAIVEVASGDDYHHFVIAQLFRSAHLRNTGFSGTAAARSVVPAKGDTPPRLAASTWGDAGVYSTTHDMLTWYRALRSGRVLTDASVAELFAPVTPIEEGRSALGWFISRTQSGITDIFTRGNEDYGPNSLLYAYPASNMVVIVLTHAGDASDDLSWSRLIHRKIETLLFP